MKYYSTEKVKEYIEQNKENILSVECGMQEDWSWTAVTVYYSFDNKENSYVDFVGYSDEIDWDKKYLKLAGITGSYWATPVMNVNFADGSYKIVPCWVEDEKEADWKTVSEMKLFAKMTGGMDSVN